MSRSDMRLSRISKLFVDRDQARQSEALSRRQSFTTSLLCGDDVASSYTLQLAVLTAANIASRCFPGAVRVALTSKVAEAPLLVWPQLKSTFGAALRELLSEDALIAFDKSHQWGSALIFGDAPAPEAALRVTFDGWIAKVGPVPDVARLPEREYFAPAGVLAASLAMSELFLRFADMNIEACSRVVGMSLWRPDLDISDPNAVGPKAMFGPAAMWVLGLGHLGNAYLWTLSTLPYEKSSEVTFSLFDFDKVEPENVETGVLFVTDDEEHPKAQVCDAWLRARGFKTRLYERKFDETFRLQRGSDYREPELAFSGFDSNVARRSIPTAGFAHAFDSGLGGSSKNFDTIAFHAWPNPRASEDLWVVPTEAEQKELAQQHEKAAAENAAYQELDGDDCGRALLAGKSVAVPFVGLTAASLVVAAAARLLHGGSSYPDIRLKLGTPGSRYAVTPRNHGPEELAGVTFASLKR